MEGKSFKYWGTPDWAKDRETSKMVLLVLVKNLLYWEISLGKVLQEIHSRHKIRLLLNFSPSPQMILKQKECHYSVHILSTYFRSVSNNI
jgi:hypothetical protein